MKINQVTILFFALLLTNACNGQTTEKVRGNYVEVHVETDCSSSTVGVEFPVCNNEQLKDHILSYIDESLRDCKENMSEEAQSKIAGRTFSALSEQDYEAYLHQFAQSYADEYAEQHRPDVEAAAEDDFYATISWDYSLELRQKADAPLFVSYELVILDFTGGAHGMYGFNPTTLRKDNGKPVGEILKPGSEENIQPLLWRALLSGIKDKKERQEYKTSIEEYLGFTQHNVSYLPLPSAFWLSKGNVHLRYQPYEICNWAMGAPELVIPAKDLRAYLTDEAIELLQLK